MSEKIKVVICEDHTFFREGVKSFLNSKPDVVVVSETGNGAQLLHLLSYMPKDKFPDVVLLDINMPFMRGEEALPKVKEAYPDLKVIIVSMHNEIDVISKMMSLGANSYICKTSDSEEMYKAIVQCHNYEYYFTEDMNKVLLQNFKKSPNVETPSADQQIDSEKSNTRYIESDPGEVLIPQIKAPNTWQKRLVWGLVIGIAVSVFAIGIIYAYLYMSERLTSISKFADSFLVIN